MKRLPAAILTIAMTLSLAACGTQPSNPAPGSASGGEPPTGSSNGRKEPTYVIQYSHVQSEITPTHRAML